MAAPNASVSIVISVHNGGRAFRDCLDSLAQCPGPWELIVVDDGSTDDAIGYATDVGARVFRLGSRRGPANGRNIGVLAATGDIVVTLDADVCVCADTIAKFARRFEMDPELGAVFGSYDAEPAARELVSQFRNLVHCFVHQTSERRASTFWAGCGAFRRQVFLDHGGFDVAYSVPCVEDIEFGMRLARKGVRIELDPAIQVKHLKRWTLRGMIVTDIRRRGIPWTRLILENDRIPNDLNLRVASRFSVALTAALCFLFLLAGAAAIAGRPSSIPWLKAASLVGILVASVIALNFAFYRFLRTRRNVWFAARCVPLHLIYFFCCGVGFVCGVAIHHSLLLRRPLAGPPPSDTLNSLSPSEPEPLAESQTVEFIGDR